MRVLVVNPNTTTEFTQKIRESVTQYKRAGVKVDVVNPENGPASIECVYDELLSVEPTLKLLALISIYI